MEPLEIVTFKKLFVEVNVPYSVKKNEQIEIPATVYNYGNKNTKVRLLFSQVSSQKYFERENLTQSFRPSNLVLRVESHLVIRFSRTLELRIGETRM